MVQDHITGTVAVPTIMVAPLLWWSTLLLRATTGIGQSSSRPQADRWL